MNIMFGLLPPLDTQLRRKMKNKRDRHHLQVELGLKEFEIWRLNYLTSGL
jgi:hypothetical protein